jgi:hypothetical protein
MKWELDARTEKKENVKAMRRGIECKCERKGRRLGDEE